MRRGKRPVGQIQRVVFGCGGIGIGDMVVFSRFFVRKSGEKKECKCVYVYELKQMQMCLQ
jgi:hypothetical protein